MQDEQQTTTETSETGNSEVQTQTSETQEQGSSTSATTETTTEDSLNLGEPAKTETETKEGETAETEQKTDEPNPLFGAPAEDATYEISLGEGQAIDADALAAVAPVFRELNLSNEGATRVAQVYAEKVLPHVTEQITNNLQQQVVAQRSEWEGEARDAVAGKVTFENAAGEPLKFENTNIKQVQSVAARALDQLAPQGFRAWLDETGLGVHPQMIAFAYQAGLRLTEEREIEPSEGAEKRQLSRAEKYYGSRS